MPIQKKEPLSSAVLESKKESELSFKNTALRSKAHRRLCNLIRSYSKIATAICLIASIAALGSCAFEQEGTVNITDLQLREGGLPSLESLSRTNPHRAEITQVFALPGSKNGASGRAISTAQDGRVLLWTLPEGKAYELLAVQPGAALYAFFEPRSLLARSDSGAVTLYSLSNRAELGRLDKLKTKINALCFAPSGRSLLMAGADGRVYQWNFADQFLAASNHSLDRQEVWLEAYIGPSAALGSVAYHPSGRTFFSGDWEGGLSAWLNYSSDSFSGEYDQNYFGKRFFASQATRSSAAHSNSDAVDILRIGSNGEDLYLGLQSGHVELWSVRGFHKDCEIEAHQGQLYDLTLSPEKDSLATIARDGKLKIWEVKNINKISGAPLERKIELRKQIDIEGGRSLAFAASNRILVGTLAGSLLEVHFIQS